MNTYTIRKATTDDMPEVAIVLRTSFRHTYPNFPELHTPEEDRNFFMNVVFPKDDVYIATDASSRIVGFIAFNSVFIDHLYLLPEVQRMGIGSALIAIALKQSDHLKLWTFQVNTAAHAFYGKHGFTKVLETDGEGNQEKQPDVLFERKSRRK